MTSVYGTFPGLFGERRRLRRTGWGLTSDEGRKDPGLYREFLFLLTPCTYNVTREFRTRTEDVGHIVVCSMTWRDSESKE